MTASALDEALATTRVALGVVTDEARRLLGGVAVILDEARRAENEEQRRTLIERAIGHTLGVLCGVRDDERARRVSRARVIEGALVGMLTALEELDAAACPLPSREEGPLGARVGAVIASAEDLWARVERDGHLRGACVVGVTLEGSLAGVDMRGSQWKSSRMRCSLFRARLSGSQIDEGSWSGSDLREALLDGVRVTGTDFSEADLRGADLTGSRWMESQLRGARLEGTCLHEARFRDVDLEGVVAPGVDWSTTESLQIFPSQLKPPDLLRSPAHRFLMDLDNPLRPMLEERSVASRLGGAAEIRKIRRQRLLDGISLPPTP